MKLIALIFGLGLERIATQVLHLRELRWFDPYFDFGLDRLRGASIWLVYPGTILLVLLPMIPVAWASRELLQTGVAWDLPYLLFAVLVLFFCLGPRDLAAEVEEYCRALADADAEKAERVLSDLCEVEHSGAKDAVAVEEAIFVQATHRFFGVVFWFIALGPVGAWLFRVSDLLRRRATAIGVGDPERVTPALPAIEAVNGVLVWLPARLAVLGYALSGNFDEAFNRWRQYELKSDLPFHHSNDQVVACVGKAAMAAPRRTSPIRASRAPPRDETGFPNALHRRDGDCRDDALRLGRLTFCAMAPCKFGAGARRRNIVVRTAVKVGFPKRNPAVGAPG